MFSRTILGFAGNDVANGCDIIHDREREQVALPVASYINKMIHQTWKPLLFDILHYTWVGYSLVLSA